MNAILYLYLAAAMVISIAVVVCAVLGAVAMIRVTWASTEAYTARRNLETHLDNQVHAQYVTQRSNFHLAHLAELEETETTDGQT